MSTRGAIARTPDVGVTFKGVYHHWDSYPEGLGATLFELYRGEFQKDLPKMLRTLIDGHPAGWSTINNKDFTQEPGYNAHGAQPCVTCGKNAAAHLRQYIPHDERTEQDKAEMKAGNYHRLDHSYVEPENDRPECFCHGDRSEEGWEVTHENASGSGVEYVYAFDEATDKMYVLSSYCGPGDFEGQKMVGAFGSGDESATWHVMETIDLNQPAPEWATVTA